VNSFRDIWLNTELIEKIFQIKAQYLMKILLGDFNAEVGREDVFKPTIGNESLHEISNDNGVRVQITVATRSKT
jgi:hypothetical protein